MSKNNRIEELLQQHHTDRVKLHEVSEKASVFDTEMASLKSSLAHEQAHRQRLETRLRSLMSTPEYAAENLGGGGGKYSVYSICMHSVCMMYLYVFLYVYI